MFLPLIFTKITDAGVAVVEALASQSVNRSSISLTTNPKGFANSIRRDPSWHSGMGVMFRVYAKLTLSPFTQS